MQKGNRWFRSLSIILAVLMCFTSVPMVGTVSFASEVVGSEQEEQESYAKETVDPQVSDNSVAGEDSENEAIEAENEPADEEDADDESLTEEDADNDIDNESLTEEIVEGVSDNELSPTPEQESENLETVSENSLQESDKKCGDNLYWDIKDGVLTITGSGDMYDYEYGYEDMGNQPPWRSSKVTSLVLSDQMTSIGAGAFNYCDGLKGSLTIPDSVTTIGDGAFYYCSGFTGSLVIPNSVKHLGSYVFYGCSGFTGSLTIGDNVTKIEEEAFNSCGFTGSLTIGDSVTEIGRSAFLSCKFTGNLSIPDSVTAIKDTAFSSCEGFTGSLIIPDSVTEIGAGAFEYCSGFTGSLTIQGNVEIINNFAFRGCTGFMGTLTIPDSVTQIGDSAFKDCSGFTGHLAIPSSVEVIDDNAFLRCEGFTGSLIIPEGVTIIGESAFGGCYGFTGNLTIPEGVITVRGYAFEDCWGLTGNLIIPSSVTDISGASISGCKFNKIINNSTVSIVLPGEVEWYKDGEKVTKLANGTAIRVTPVTLQPIASAIGEVEKNTPVTLKSETKGADIYYTTDGSYPNVYNGVTTGTTKLYTDAIPIDKDMTIKAFAVCNGYPSRLVSFKYKIINQSWGDLEADTKVKALFTDADKVPEGLWYVLGDSLYTNGGTSSFEKTYTGNNITFNDEISIYDGTRKLWENRDYTITYKNNQNIASKDAGKKAPTVVIKGIGNYTNTAEFNFSIIPESITNAELTSETTVSVKAGTMLNTVKPVLMFGTKKLVLNRDYTLSYTDEGGNPVDGKIKTEAGKSYAISINGKNNFDETYATKIVVKVVDPKDKSVVLMSKVKVTMPKAKDMPYKDGGYSLIDLFDNSEGKTALAKVINGKEELVYGTDFTVDKEVYTDTGKYTIRIHGTAIDEEGKISYVGDKLATLQISGIAASKVKVAGLFTNVEYRGEAYGLSDLYNKADKTAQKNGFSEVTLYTVINKTNTILTEGTDYDVEMVNNGSTGKITVIFTLKGKYSGVIKKTVNVKARNIKDAKITLGGAYYSKAGAIPETVVVKLGDDVLREGIDYTLSYKNNVKAANKNSGKNAPTVTVKGKGNYTGNKSATFTVNKAYITDCVSLVSVDKIYNAKAKKDYFKSIPKLMDGGKAISIGKDIDRINVKTACKYYYAETGEEISSTDIVAANTLIEVRLSVTCGENSPYKAGQYELKGYYKIIDTGKDIKSAKVVMKNKNIQFNNGKAIIPLKESDLVVTVGKQVLSASDYEIVSIKNNRFLGTATVEIRGKGSYGGTKKFTFKISAKALK